MNTLVADVSYSSAKLSVKSAYYLDNSNDVWFKFNIQLINFPIF